MILKIPGYKITRPIAEGGMAAVYLAVQESLERPVVLKLLKKFTDVYQSTRFVNEGRIIASLNHHNIITIYDIGVIGERHYLSMEYVQGGNLEDRILEGMKPAAALDLVEVIGGCLDFLHKKNINKWEPMAKAAEAAGLNVDQLKADYESTAKALFQEDLQLARELGVRGFPSIFFVDESGNREFVYGSKPYSAYENAIQKLLPTAKKSAYDTTWRGLFSKFKTLTAKEFSVLSEMDRQETEQFLGNLTEEGRLEKYTTKNGAIWKLISK